MKTPADTALEILGDMALEAREPDKRKLLTALRETLREEIERLQKRIDDAPLALMDTRSELGVCAIAEADFQPLYALRGRRVRLVIDARKGD